MSRALRRLTIGALALITAVSTVGVSVTSAAATAPAASPATSTANSAAPDGSGLPSAARPPVLGQNWRTSTDTVWSLTSSANGLGVLTARVSSGVAWKQVNTLKIAGIDSRQWVGQGCLLVNSHVLAVMFGPVEDLDLSSAYEAGGYAALVNLDTGAITALTIRPTFSYFSPSCGADGTAEFTSFGAAESTTSVSVVTATGKVTAAVMKIGGELTGATDDASGTTTAIAGNTIVSVRGGRASTLVTAAAAPYDLRPTADGGLAYLVDGATATTAHRYLRGHDDVIATAASDDLSIDTAADGGLVVHGRSARAGSKVAHVRVAKAASDAAPSLAGSTFVQVTGSPGVGAGVTAEVSSADGASASEDVPASVFTETAATATITGKASVDATSGETTDDNLPCAIQRNDVNVEVYQPSVAQVEWAVDQAVDGNLTTAHPANYRNSGLPSYSPQGMFPLTPLVGGGKVPPQILLGILANESNLWQASGHVARGGYGNPLTGNIYGRTLDANGSEELNINFDQADCGYGIAQVTDGMRLGQLDPTKQRAIAFDYEANIAAGLNILIQKWNQLASYNPSITMNEGDPQWIESWYAAAWAYNSGLQPNAANGNTTGCTPGPDCTDSAGNWGLGWANNPDNPIYKAGRHMFNSRPADAASPSSWPYQERIIGWAAYPIYEDGGSYAQAYWLSNAARSAAIPSPKLFCTAANHCTAATRTCQYPDTDDNPLALHCWTHYPVTWKVCAGGDECGYGQSTYTSDAAEPADPASTDPADCNSSALPADATIVDDLTNSDPSPFAPCNSVETSGSFAFSFTADGNGNYPAHIDLHQINGGLNGHYWFTHTTQVNDDTAAVGTWNFPPVAAGWGRLMVHVPAAGGQTPQAHYTITDGATGTTQQRTLNQGWGTNTWVSLGSFQFTVGETVSLSSFAPDDTSQDVAWDAVAFVPGVQPTYKVVALGDSYSSGEGVEPYSADSDNPNDGCHRSTRAYSALITLPAQTVPLGQNANDEYDFLACSGAHSTSITGNAVDGPHDEDPYDTDWGTPYFDHDEDLQADSGYLDASTDAVTLSIGGNDARFADVIKACTISGALFHDCSGDGFVMPGDDQSLNTLEPHIISDLLPGKLESTYLAIHQAAPNAVIYVVGYPMLFPATEDERYAECPANLTLSGDDEGWINSMSVLMTNTISTAVAAVAALGVNIHFVDPTAAFTGHDVCASAAWINGIVARSSSGSGSTSPGTGSFHPKAAGQAAYARLVTAAMAQWQPVKLGTK